jgi:DNA-directed RNA polymerase subunit beta'
MKSLTKFQLILVNSIQAIYDSQGVTIASKHIDTIVRQMTSKVIVEDGGDSPFLPGELVSLALMNQVILGFQKVHETNEQSKLSITYKLPNYQPNLLSITNSALMKQGFLSSAGFQETRRILSTAAIEGRSDWLRGLKESVIIGRLIPAGTSFFNYRNNLDLFYQKKLRNRGIKIQLPLADELNSLENQENLEEKRKEILERKYKAIQNSKETETSLSSVK